MSDDDQFAAVKILNMSGKDHTLPAELRLGDAEIGNYLGSLYENSETDLNDFRISDSDETILKTASDFERPPSHSRGKLTVQRVLTLGHPHRPAAERAQPVSVFMRKFIATAGLTSWTNDSSRTPQARTLSVIVTSQVHTGIGCLPATVAYALLATTRTRLVRVIRVLLLIIMKHSSPIEVIIYMFRLLLIHCRVV